MQQKYLKVHNKIENLETENSFRHGNTSVTNSLDSTESSRRVDCLRVLILTADLAGTRPGRGGTETAGWTRGRQQVQCATLMSGLHFLPMQDPDAAWTGV